MTTDDLRRLAEQATLLDERDEARRFASEYATALNDAERRVAALEAVLGAEWPLRVERCVTHHGCECREYFTHTYLEARALLVPAALPAEGER